MKLKIGTIEKKKEKIDTIIDNYTDDYTDEELEAMSKEANEPNDFDLTETEEIPEEVKKELEADMKEATNDVFILDEGGINIEYAEKYLKLFPKKKIVYQNFLTKTFLKWYITNAKISLLKDLYAIESEFVKPAHQKEIMALITKRMKAPVELEDIGTLGTPKLVGESTELETKEQIDAYEFLLTEKWNADERAKGIQQLDAIIEEQMRVKGFDLNQALKHILNGFHLTSKFGIEKKLKKPELKEEVITAKTKFKKVKKDRSNAEVSKELDKSIKRFHHIKFLYELMSEKMDFIGTPTIEEIEKITVIKGLLYDSVNTPKEKKEVDDHQTIGQMMIDNAFSGGYD